MDRNRFARLSYWILTGIGVLLVAMLVASQWPSIISGERPPTQWMLPIGCLTIIFGIHAIYFRREDSEWYSQVRARWGLDTFSSSPGCMVIYGLVAVIIGIVVVCSVVAQ